MKLEEIHAKTMELLKDFDVRSIMPDLKGVSEGSMRDILDKQNSLYYQYLACLMRVLNPKQIVELGGAMGSSALCMISQLPSDAKLYSITLEERGLEFSYVKDEYPQLVKVLGDDLKFDSWPKDMRFEDTDLLFIDSLHTKEHLLDELDIYIPMIGTQVPVLLDDTKMNEGMWQAWLAIKKPKLDLSVLHHTGFGIFMS